MPRSAAGRRGGNRRPIAPAHLCPHLDPEGIRGGVELSILFMSRGGDGGGGSVVGDGPGS